MDITSFTEYKNILVYFSVNVKCGNGKRLEEFRQKKYTGWGLFGIKEEFMLWKKNN